MLREIGSIRLDAASTLSGTDWVTLVETDDDAIPSHRPVVISKTIGAGRILVIGDTSIFYNDDLEIRDNKQFVIQIMDWLLFRI